VGGLEIELKAGLDPRSAAALARRLTLRAGPPETRSLAAVYLDTADRRLQAAGIALRVRREGRRWVQAAKWGRSGHGGFQQLHEVECRLPGPKADILAFPDPALRSALAAAAAGAELVPWFETRVRRRIWQVRHAIGLVEVALDRGTIEAGEAVEPVLEAEFELKAGSPEAVFALAASLLGDLPADLLLPSKAARGGGLAQGAKARAGGRRKPGGFPADAEGAASWTALLALHATTVAAELHRLHLRDDAEGPHQLRVALRRLRAAERLHRPLLDPDVAAEIADGARTLGRIVAPLRDSDVMIETFCADGGVSAALALALTDRRARTREQVRRQLRSAGATAFAIRLLQLANIGGWRPAGRSRPMPVGQLAEKSLQIQWKRLSKLGDRLSTLDDEERHEFRKSLKKARYLLEIHSEPGSKEFKSHLKRLQESLGILNDLSVLAGWSGQDLSDEVRAAFDAVREALLRSALARADLALGRACRHWRTLRALPRPWGQQPAP
jgi:triphosphatase